MRRLLPVVSPLLLLLRRNLLPNHRGRMRNKITDTRTRAAPATVLVLVLPRATPASIAATLRAAVQQTVRHPSARRALLATPAAAVKAVVHAQIRAAVVALLLPEAAALVRAAVVVLPLTVAVAVAVATVAAARSILHANITRILRATRRSM